MNAFTLPFSKADIGDDEIAEVVATLRSGWLTSGPKVKQFEADFSTFLGGDCEAICVNSATSGLHLALEACGIGPGDEVITTTHTFTATAEVIRYLGAHPILIDIDPQTLCIDATLIERAITSRTRAVIPVHFAGRGADLTHICEIARRHNLRVIEDAAHAFPATFAGKLIGTHDTDATVFSFYANKTITTGEGGMLVTRDPAIAARARIMRLHGISRDVYDRFTTGALGWQYDVIAPGFKYNMTDVSAAIGIHQLRKACFFRQRREQIASAYHHALSSLPISLPQPAVLGETSAWHLYVIQLDPFLSITRDAFIHGMLNRGISCSVHYIPLHLHPYWATTYKLHPHMFPVSQAAYERSVSLPIYSSMTDTDVQRVITAASETIE